MVFSPGPGGVLTILRPTDMLIWGLFAALGGWLKNVLFPNTSSKAYSIIILYPGTLFICVLLNSLSLQLKVRVHEGRDLVWLVFL